MFYYEIEPSLKLSILQQQYSDDLFNLVDQNREYLRQWLPWVDSTKSVGDTKSFISMTQKQFSSNDGFQAGIFVDNKMEGVIGFHRIDWSNKKTSIGYWLSEKSQGNGAMTKSCIALIDHAFNILNLNKVEISCASENLKSQNIPKRLNFKEEGISRDAEWLYDHFVNHINYGILKSEWKR